MPARLLLSKQLTQATVNRKGSRCRHLWHKVYHLHHSQLLLPTELEREIGKDSSGLLAELTRLLLTRQPTQSEGVRQGNDCSHHSHKLHTFVMQGSVCSHLCHKVPHISGRRTLASGAGQCLLSTLWIPPRQIASLYFKTFLGSHNQGHSL